MSSFSRKLAESKEIYLNITPVPPVEVDLSIQLEEVSSFTGAVDYFEENLFGAVKRGAQSFTAGAKDMVSSTAQGLSGASGKPTLKGTAKAGMAVAADLIKSPFKLSAKLGGAHSALTTKMADLNNNSDGFGDVMKQAFGPDGAPKNADGTDGQDDIRVLGTPEGQKLLSGRIIELLGKSGGVSAGNLTIGTFRVKINHKTLNSFMNGLESVNEFRVGGGGA